MTAAVVDTNVLRAANGTADHVSPRCVLASLDALQRVQAGGRIVIDDGFEILREYQNHANPGGQPGAGDAFLKWAFLNQYNPVSCERVTITPHPDRGYDEFPTDPALATFDRSDRKFVAVALGSAGKPQVLVAIDRGWWNHRDALATNGVTVDFLCEEIGRPRR